MRTIKEIREQMRNYFIAHEVIQSAYGIKKNRSFEDIFSKVSFESVLMDVFVIFVYLQEQLFDKHKSEVSDAILLLKPHTLRWYRSKALAFQYGFDLLEDSDQFDNKDSTEEEIEASIIVKYSAVVESESQSRLIVKIAGEESNKLSPISETQEEAFVSYINEIKDAGVRITVINYLPDRLNLSLDIYRDPLILDESGNSRITGRKPVEDAIIGYMKELPFNGELVLAHLIDRLQLIEGVKIPHVVSASSSWINPEMQDYGNETEITVRTIPESGYFEVMNFENIRYVV